MLISYAGRLGAVALMLLPAAAVVPAGAASPPDDRAVAATCGAWLDAPEWSTHGIVAASNARGRTFVAWKAQSASREEPTEAVHGRFISRSGRLGPVLDLSPEEPEAGPVSVGMDARGNVLLGLGALPGPVDELRTWVRRVSRSGRLGTLHRLGDDTRDVYGAAVALTPGGRGLAVVDVPATDVLAGHVDLWDVRGQGAPRLARRVPVSDLGGVVAVSGGGTEDLYVLLSGLDDAPVTVTGYVARAGRVRRVDVGRGIDTTVGMAAMGVDGKGRAHLLLDAGPPGTRPRTLARTWDGRAVSRPRFVGRVPTGLMQGRFDVDATGAGPAYWSTGVDRQTYELHVGHVPARGRVSRVRGLGVPDTYDVGGTTLEWPVAPQAGIDSDGAGLIAWKPEDDDAVTGDETLLVRSVRPDGRLGTRLHTFGVTHDVLVLAPDGARPMLARTADVGAGITRVCLERRRW